MAKFWLVSDQSGQEAKHELMAPGPITVGRATTCNIVIDNKQVSRTHANLTWAGGQWSVSDAGSSGGTFVNDRKLEPGSTQRLADGDTLTLGPVRMAVVDEDGAGAQATLMGGGDASSERFERVKPSRPEEFAHSHLVLMLEVSEAIHKSQDAESTRRMLVDAAAKATGFENIAFVRRTDVGEGVELLYQVGDVMDRTGKLRMSRTMLRNARNGIIVVSDATKSSDAAIAASLEKMSVQRAICIPVQWDKTNFGFLYLDNGKSRGDGRDEERLKEAAGVADALARMAAQNLGNLSHVEEMDQIWRATLQMMVDCVEGRDPYTGGHSRRVAEFAKLLCESAGMDAAMIALIYQCGRVHDIGKITVDDAVLRKPGKLTEQEFAEIAKHPEAGHKILREHPLMRDVLPGVLEHHEKWDGTGYPHKKAGEGISLIGRIIAIADVFDAITSKRPYRDGFPLEKAMAIIQQDAGTHFDPALAKAFAKVPLQIFAEIHERIRPEVR